MRENAPIPALPDAWKAPGSLGFSTWKRHATAGVAGRMILPQRGESSLLGIHDRHASFTSSLIARQFSRTASGADTGKFIFRSAYSGQKGVPEEAHLRAAPLPMLSRIVTREMPEPAPERSSSTDRNGYDISTPVGIIPAPSGKPTVAVDSTLIAPRPVTAPGVDAPCRPTGGRHDFLGIDKAVSSASQSIARSLVHRQEHSVIRSSLPVSAVAASSHEPLVARSSVPATGKTALGSPAFAKSARDTQNMTPNTLHRATHRESSIEARGERSGPAGSQASSSKPTLARSLTVQSAAGRALVSGKSDPGSDGSLPSGLARRPAMAGSHRRVDLQPGYPTLMRRPVIPDSMAAAPHPRSTQPGRLEGGSWPVRYHNISLASPEPHDHMPPLAAPPSSATGGSATVTQSDPGSTVQVFPGSKVPALQRHPASERSVLPDVRLYPMALSELARSPFPIPGLLSNSARHVPYSHASLLQPRLQRKQTHDEKHPLGRREHLALHETPLQRTEGSGNAPHPAGPGVTKGSSPKIYTNDITARPYPHPVMSRSAAPALGAQRSRYVTHPLAMKHHAISAHALAETPIRRSMDGLPGRSLASALPMIGGTQSSGRIFRKSAEAAAPEIRLPDIVQSGNVSTSSFSLPQASGPDSGKAADGKHQAKPRVQPVTISYPLSINPRLFSNIPIPGIAISRSMHSTRPLPLAMPYGTYPRTAGTPMGSSRIQRTRITNASRFMDPEGHVRIEESGDTSGRRAYASDNRMPGFFERPLAGFPRMQTRLMRASSGTAIRTRPHDVPAEERYGVVSPPGGESGGTRALTREMTFPSVSAPEAADPQATAEQTWRTIAERLVVEQERRGLAKWI